LIDETLPPPAEQALHWLEPLLPWLTAVGIAFALVSLLALPVLVVLMPRDYFVAPRRPQHYRGPVLWVLLGLRNALAIILMVAGLFMTVLPGQGLLTVLIGIMVSTFPGKYRLERWLVRQKGVFHALNWIRGHAGRTPMYYPAPGTLHGTIKEDAHE